MFEGLVGMMSSMNIGNIVDRMDLGASFQALNYAERAVSMMQYAQQLVTIVARGAAGDWLGVVTELVGVDPREIGNIISVLKQKGLAALTTSGLSTILAQARVGIPVIQFHINLPDTGNIGKALKLARNIFGRSNRGQEFVGEMGTALMFYLMGFQDAGLQRAYGVNGPDGIVRNKLQQNVWAIYEAKGGTGRLGTSTLSRPSPFPRQMALQGLSPGRSYAQFGKEWLQFWMIKTIGRNPISEAGIAFKAAYDSRIPMLTSVVSVNLKRVNEELKFAAQVFLPPDGIGFSDWPKGF
jgi:hypothetical protein